VRIFSYTLVGRDEEWYDSIFPGAITSWDIFQERFAKRCEKKRYRQSLYDELYNYKRKPRESIKDFNDRFNTLVRSFPQDFKPSQSTILKSYISTMKDPYGFIIGKGCPTTLFEAQERECDIEEKMAFSLYQDEDCFEEVIQVNQVAYLVILDPPHSIRTYLQREQEEVINQVVGHMMSLLGKNKEPTSEEITPPIKEILKVEIK
jgi:hypothetical protein